MAALAEMEQEAYLSVLLCLATQALDWVSASSLPAEAVSSQSKVADCSSGLVSARSNLTLSQGKEQLLGDLRQVLNISMDDHKRHLDAALADPRVQAIKRGDEDVPVSFAGRWGTASS